MTKLTKVIAATSIAAGMIGSASAAIVVHGSTTAYQETGGDWLTMGTNDADGSGGLGTDGFRFAGDLTPTNFNSTEQGNSGTFDGVGTLPSYVTSLTAHANVAGTAWGFGGYGDIDDPNLVNGTDAKSGFWIANGAGGGAGTSQGIVNFTVSGLASGQTVRVGLLAGIEGNADGRWNPTSLTLTEGANSATVGSHGVNNLSADPGGTNTGWVFFDIDADGDYAVSGTKRLAGQGAGIAGLTFDTVAVPEPSSAALLGLGGLVLILRRRK